VKTIAKTSGATASEPSVIDRVTKMCREHPTMGLKEMSDRVGVSMYHLHRTYKRMTGKCIKRVRAEAQVELAKRLIRDGLTLIDIADQCGFAHQSHFTARFKQLTGQTPTQYRAANRSAGEKAEVRPC
jgi:AraC family transcriptional regulator